LEDPSLGDENWEKILRYTPQPVSENELDTDEMLPPVHFVVHPSVRKWTGHGLICCNLCISTKCKTIHDFNLHINSWEHMENMLKPEFRLPKDYSDPRFQTGYEMLPAKSRFASVKAYVLATLHALLGLQWDDASLTHLTEMVFRAFEECSDETPKRYDKFRGPSWKFKRTKRTIGQLIPR